ncbi:AEC family transporter [Methylobacterium sp. C25]|uniref:AEC family transporter n=1 Tax=Methylobacterium sp. C25 TaxID=2721622 RepID=UPI001F2CC59A|nr:AEC family transporter [Methylobacterium sp. C25]MCE4225223.1 AEC family transporter [Methylobacterium sp. C25]
MTALTLVIPIFGLVMIGWLAALTKVLSDRVSEGLSEYVFAIAIPALIITTLTRPGMNGEIAWGYWFSYFGGVAVAWAIASFIGIRREGVDRRGAILHGFAASQSNTIFVGVPMILQAYGEDGAFPLFMLLAVHLPLMMGAATFLIESDGNRSLADRIKGLGLVLIKNPIFLALLTGMAMKVFGIMPSGMVKTLLTDIGSTASTCALIALGAALRRYRVLHDLPGASIIAALKLGMHPFAVYVLAFHVFTMPPAYAGVAVLFAAMPVGINSYLLAARYRTEQGVIAASLLVSTIAGAATTVGWLLVLGRA